MLEAFRSGRTIDRLYLLEGQKEGVVQTILREAKKGDTIIQYVSHERMDQLSQTGSTRE